MTVARSFHVSGPQFPRLPQRVNTLPRVGERKKVKEQGGQEKSAVG